jgi:hypothetical protein
VIRKAGFYWVRFADPVMPQEARVWEWDEFSCRWLRPGDDNEYCGADVVVLSERLEPPSVVIEVTV